LAEKKARGMTENITVDRIFCAAHDGCCRGTAVVSTDRGVMYLGRPSAQFESAVQMCLDMDSGILRRSWCACRLLREVLRKGFRASLFGRMNSRTLRLVFEDVVSSGSYVEEAGFGPSWALLEYTGRVVTWGSTEDGAWPSGAVAGRLESGVVQVVATRLAFAALKDDGSVVTWGAGWAGGDSSGVALFLASGVVRVEPLQETAFVARKAGGEQVVWGHLSGLQHACMYGAGRELPSLWYFLQ